MNEPSLHKAPTIVSTHNAAVSYYNPTGRPPTIAELTEIAQAHDWGDGPDLNWQVARGERNLKYWLLLAQELRNDAENFERRGRIADAFVQYAKSARIVMEGLPAHPDYQTLLTQQQRLNLRLVCIVTIIVTII
jgi:STAM-binding protein